MYYKMSKLTIDKFKANKKKNGNTFTSKDKNLIIFESQNECVKCV